MSDLTFGKSLELTEFCGDRSVVLVLRIQKEEALGGTFLVIDPKTDGESLIIDVDARKMARWILENTEPDEDEGIGAAAPQVG